MERHRFLRAAAAVLMGVSLVATPVLATTTFDHDYFKVFLPAIDEYGCFDWDDPDGGDCVSFCACVNTCTGKFCVHVCGCVENESGSGHCYCNPGFCIEDCEDGDHITPCSDFYKVYCPCKCYSKVSYCAIAVDCDYVKSVTM